MLGSNEGDRGGNMLAAIEKLIAGGTKVLETSPIYINPALLLENSPDDWNRPYYNCVIKIDTELSPEKLLKFCKEIEKDLGRDFSKKFGPRPIDLDILFYRNQTVSSEKLTIPHREIYNRSFVLDPLSFVYPEKTGNHYSQSHQPVFMGILNITPDSFSDGGKFNSIDSFLETFEHWEKKHVAIIDIGAESTNRNSRPLAEDEEIDRLKPIFAYTRTRKFAHLRSRLSIDTYHPKTAELALENGFDIVNDVSGFGDKRMLDLAREHREAKFVFMHNLGLPAGDSHIGGDTLETIGKWIENKIKIFESAHLDRNRLILDVGIGFGKTATQNLKILQNINHFHHYGFPILVGHSRKSFMGIFTEAEANQRDIETLAISLKLARNVDILRVHTPVEHNDALLAYDHINNQFIGPKT
jgi:2-amino-4-hydroxy-6-hydroxymethyldihydropteridine diphosphokinase/dihydropteroate synthase